MDRTGKARWEGDLKQGKGSFTVGSGSFGGAYSFNTRFGDTPGTNPEELIGAAHASCFSMAFSAALAKAGFVPTSVETVATVHLGMVDGGFAITGIDLNCTVVVADVSRDVLEATAESAKKTCPVSKALAAVPITLTLNP
ncbi:MAG: OsmC family protein [Gemmatimonadota bacterium]